MTGTAGSVSGDASGGLGAVAVAERDRQTEARGDRPQELTRTDEDDAGGDRVHPLGSQVLAERAEHGVVEAPGDEDRHDDGHRRRERPRSLDGEHLVEHTADDSERQGEANEHDERVHLWFLLRGARRATHLSSTSLGTLGYRPPYLFSREEVGSLGWTSIRRSSKRVSAVNPARSTR